MEKKVWIFMGDTKAYNICKFYQGIIFTFHSIHNQTLQFYQLQDAFQW